MSTETLIEEEGAPTVPNQAGGVADKDRPLITTTADRRKALEDAVKAKATKLIQRTKSA